MGGSMSVVGCIVSFWYGLRLLLDIHAQYYVVEKLKKLQDEECFYCLAQWRSHGGGRFGGLEPPFVACDVIFSYIYTNTTKFVLHFPI